MKRPRILFVMHMPPPVHGAAVVGAQIRDSRLIQEEFECRFVNLSTSASLEDIGKGRLRKVFSILRILRDEWKELSHWKPDLVYVTPTSTLPALWKDFAVVCLARRKGCRVILHFHNKGVASRAGRWLDNWVYRILFRRVSVILLSSALKEDVLKYVPEEQIYVCPNGLDFQLDESSTERSVPRLLFLSNLLVAKGVVDLLDACKLMMDRNISFECCFVGAPTARLQEKDFERMVRERGLERIVTYEGPRYGKEKQRILRQSDVFVHPTREDCFPLVILEAMACGLPVVSTEEGGIVDEVEDGVTGFLCRKGDPVSLASAVSQLLTDASLRERMGQAGRERYKKLFTASCFERRLAEILRAHV